MSVKEIQRSLAAVKRLATATEKLTDEGSYIFMLCPRDPMSQLASAVEHLRTATQLLIDYSGTLETFLERESNR